MNLSHTLTLDDVIFDRSTGTIKEYIADYKCIAIPDNFDGMAVATIGEFTFANHALTSVKIPDSVTIISEFAFANNALTSVVMPDSLTTIREFAFYNNALTSVIIPDSATIIGGSTFDYNVTICCSLKLRHGTFADVHLHCA